MAKKKQGTPHWVYATVVAVLIVAVLLGVALNMPAPAAPLAEEAPTEPAREPEHVEVDLRVSQVGYSPDEIEAYLGDNVTLRIRSTDGLEHSFTMPIYGIDEVIAPGEEVVIEFVADKPGMVQYFSAIASNPNAGNIRGVFTVK